MLVIVHLVLLCADLVVAYLPRMDFAQTDLMTADDLKELIIKVRVINTNRDAIWIFLCDLEQAAGTTPLC